MIKNWKVELENSFSEIDASYGLGSFVPTECLISRIILCVLITILVVHLKENSLYLFSDSIFCLSFILFFTQGPSLVTTLFIFCFQVSEGLEGRIPARFIQEIRNQSP